MDIQCLKCKGRHLCKRSYCPIQAKIATQKRVNITAKQDYFGESPNVFVGHYGYPNLNVGFLNVEEYNNHDDPLLWSREGYDINRVIQLRSELINSQFKAAVTDARKGDRLVEMGKEIAMASEPVDVEINLEKKPHFSLNFSQDTAPYGPRVKLKKAVITENPKIPDKVEKLVDDFDLKANDAVNILYEKGFDEHYLTKLLSVGTLGVKTQRKIVPTRWSISSIDSNISKNNINSYIKNYSLADYSVYYGCYLGNHYLILLFPEVWSYELFETYVGSADYKWPFATDYEPYEGRKNYAENTAGGYYSVRLAISDKLRDMKKQASVLTLRFIDNDYWAPLGVWVTRQTARRALNSKPLTFSSKELMLKYVEIFVKKKFNYNVSLILQRSILLNKIKNQSKLTKFV